jgi:DNA-binding XRE family transcriptional regulator
MDADHEGRMIDPEAITEARRALGRQLAAYREAAGLIQEQLAPLIHYGRSTIANAETGYSTCSRTFWERCDKALKASGDLLRGYDEFKALTRQQQAEIAQRMEAERSARYRQLQGLTAADGNAGQADRPDANYRDDAAEELRERLLNAAAVDARAIALLGSQANRIREVDRMLGARAAEAQMRGHLEALDLLHRFTVRANQREALADLYADAAALAGWQCLDLGDLSGSWRHHEAARNTGREGRSLAALAHAMAQQAYVLVELSELASAMQLAEYSRSVAGSAAPPLLLSWLWAVQAELYAASGNAVACGQAFEIAERLLPSEAHDPELPYIVLSEVHLVRWRGNAFAQLGDKAAIGDLQTALYGLDSSFTRAKAGLHVDLAWALAAADRCAGARAELHEAKTLATRVGSARQRRRVLHLESVLGTA